MEWAVPWCCCPGFVCAGRPIPVIPVVPVVPGSGRYDWNDWNGSVCPDKAGTATPGDSPFQLFQLFQLFQSFQPFPFFCFSFSRVWAAPARSIHSSRAGRPGVGPVTLIVLGPASRRERSASSRPGIVRPLPRLGLAPLKMYDSGLKHYLGDMEHALTGSAGS